MIHVHAAAGKNTKTVMAKDNSFSIRKEPSGRDIATMSRLLPVQLFAVQ